MAFENQDKFGTRVVLALEEEWSTQKNNFLLWIPVFLGVGIVLYFSLRFEPSVVFSIFCVILLCSLFFIFKQNQIFRAVWVTVLLVAAGFLSAQIRTIMVQNNVIEKSLGPVEMVGNVQDIEYLPGGKLRLLLSSLAVDGVDAAELPHFIRLQYRGEHEISLRDEVHVLAHLHPPGGPVFPAGFDFQRYAYFKRIGAVGFIYKDLSPPVGKAEKQEWNINDLRHFIAGRVNEALPEQEASIVNALLVGMRRAISDSDVEAMRGSGLAHMLAISGLHVGMVSGLVFFIVRLFFVVIPGAGLYWPIKKIAAISAICAAVFYMMLAGATIPTQRAVVMSTLFFTAIIFDRSPFSLRFVALAALVVLCLTPEALLSASFQLSFAAVAALIFFYDVIAGWWMSMHRQAGFFRKCALYYLGVCLTTVVAGFATAPFALFHFQSWAAYGVLGNLISVPLLAFIVMPLGLVSLLAMPFGLDIYTLPLMGQGIAAILDTAHSIAGLPGALLHMHYIPNIWLIVFVCGALLVILLARWSKFIGAILCLTAMYMAYLAPLPDILISEDAKLVAVREGHDLYLNDLRAGRFARSNWEGLMGLEEGASLRWQDSNNITCDEYGCVFNVGGYDVSYAEHMEAIDAACTRSDVVISPLSLPRNCGASIEVDRWDARENGAYAIFLSPSSRSRPSIVHVKSLRGDRPWTF